MPNLWQPDDLDPVRAVEREFRSLGKHARFRIQLGTRISFVTALCLGPPQEGIQQECNPAPPETNIKIIAAIEEPALI
jgi:hypothetical protein